MAGDRPTELQVAAFERAVALMVEALDLLDGHGGPPDAVAHLEMALSRLRDAWHTRRPPAN